MLVHIVALSFVGLLLSILFCFLLVFGFLFGLLRFGVLL